LRHCIHTTLCTKRLYAAHAILVLELIPLYEPETTARRKPKALQPKGGPTEKTMLDQFMSVSHAQAEAEGAERQEEEESGGHEGGEGLDEDVVMNEDGTMTFDGL
jgi:hypothetical protein